MLVGKNNLTVTQKKKKIDVDRCIERQISAIGTPKSFPPSPKKQPTHSPFEVELVLYAHVSVLCLICSQTTCVCVL